MFRVLTACLLLLLITVLPAVSHSADPATGRYVITLASALKPLQPGDLPAAAVLDKYLVYVSTYTNDGQVWYRLRLGFFDSVAQARPVLLQQRQQYHDAWVSRTSDAEYQYAVAHRVTRAVAAAGDIGAASAESAAELLDQARQALTRGEPAAALPLLQQVLTATGDKADQGQMPEADQARQALELTGVAQERLGDTRQAMTTYRTYVNRFREGEDVVRVRQRLAALETATASTPKAMAKFEEKPRSMEWNGSFSQFSTRDTRFLDNGDTETTSILFNDLGISGRYRSERLDIRTEFDTSYRYTFNTGSTTEDDLRVSSMYVDFNDNVYNTGGRLGRQSASRGGVLGRFDGAWLSYRSSPRWKYNLVAGYPVELSTSSTINESDRYFVGMSVDMGTFARVWDLSAFGISQQINGIVDRQAMGGEIRYSSRNQSHLLLVDYDTSYQVVNSVLAVSNWFLPTQTSINIVLDSRTVPVLTTSNALIGRTEKGVDELLAILSEDEIRQLALDRTSRSYSATLGVTHPFSDKYQVNAEVTGYRQKDTPASGGVAAVDYGGTQKSYGLTVIGSSVFKEGDISIAGLRYFDSDTTRVSSVNLNVRYPLTRSWRAGPALVLDYRNNTSGVDQVTIRPSVRLDYRWLNNISFDAELALLHIKDMGDSTASDTDVFFELGYRIDF